MNSLCHLGKAGQLGVPAGILKAPVDWEDDDKPVDLSG